MLQIALARKNALNISIVILCMLSFSLVSMFYEVSRAQAAVKHLIAGGLIGAGAVLAWPTIIGGVTALASGAVAIGGAAAGAVAAGGAAVGGAIAGTGAAVGGAVVGGFGAVGGAIAAITASPLFLPALLIAGVVIGGIFVYKYFKDKEAKKSVSPYSNVTPAKGRISDDSKNDKNADKNAISSSGSSIIATDTQASTKTTQPDKISYNEDSSKAVKDRYTAAYQNYIRLLQNDSSNGTSLEITNAFKELKTVQEEYRNYLEANSGTKGAM